MTATEFIDKYYKQERLQEPGRRERIIADRKNDLRMYGEALISRHDSVTGKLVTLCKGIVV